VMYTVDNTTLGVFDICASSATTTCNIAWSVLVWQTLTVTGYDALGNPTPSTSILY
jgi:hypothetical protein